MFVLEEMVVFRFPAVRYEGMSASYDREEPFRVVAVTETASKLDAVIGEI